MLAMLGILVFFTLYWGAIWHTHFLIMQCYLSFIIYIVYILMKDLLQITYNISEILQPFIHPFVSISSDHRWCGRALRSPWVTSLGALPLMGCLPGAEIEDFSAKDSFHGPEISPHRWQLPRVLLITCPAPSGLCVSSGLWPQVSLGSLSPVIVLLLTHRVFCKFNKHKPELHNDFFFLCQQLQVLNVHQAVIIPILICYGSNPCSPEWIWIILHMYVKI